jgi:hypothetical protein
MAAAVAFALTEQDYVEAARNQYWHRIKSPKRWLWVILGLSLVFALFAYSDSCDLESFLYNLVPYVLILLVALPLMSGLCYYSVGRHARKMFKQQAIQPENRMAWDDDGLKINSSLGSLNAKWADFYGWRKVGRSYAFHMNEALYYLLPERALSAHQITDLENTLARHQVVRR